MLIRSFLGFRDIPHGAQLGHHWLIVESWSGRVIIIREIPRCLSMVPAMHTPQTETPILIVEGLSARRGGRAIFENVSFHLTSGEAAVITGPNGSGKSTLLRVLAGLLPLDNGMVTVTPELPYAICYAGHRDGLKGALTVFENLSFWSKIYGVEMAATQQVIDRMALNAVADMPADFLSAGWRRRAGLARLLLSNAPIWLLDEPYTALDTENVGRIDAVLSEHVTGGGIAILATHQLPGFEPNHRIEMSDYPAVIAAEMERDW